jgi:copper transport protein
MALHGGAMLFWIGSLIPLTAALSPLDAPAHADLLRRFSRPALTAGLVWIGSGAGLILIRPLKVDTLSTPWARLLGVKFTLVGVTLALAIWHRARAVPMLPCGQGTGASRRFASNATAGATRTSRLASFRIGQVGSPC